MKDCVQALRPPSGGGPGSMTEALERAVMVLARLLRAFLDLAVRVVWDVWVGILEISPSSSDVECSADV